MISGNENYILLKCKRELDIYLEKDGQFLHKQHMKLNEDQDILTCNVSARLDIWDHTGELNCN